MEHRYYLRDVRLVRTATSKGNAPIVNSEPKPPRITHIPWRRMEVEGLGTAKDIKLHPGGGREWEWSDVAARYNGDSRDGAESEGGQRR